MRENDAGNDGNNDDYDDEDDEKDGLIKIDAGISFFELSK